MLEACDFKSCEVHRIYLRGENIMTITSVNNEHIKELCKLKEKKYRDSTNLFLVEGEHLVNEALKKDLIEEIIALEGEKLTFDRNITYVTSTVMKKLSDLNSYPNVIGVVRKTEKNIIGRRILALDDIQDPGNLGTIIRSAVAFNIDTLILSPKTVDLYNSKVIRATQGMIFNLNIVTRDLNSTIKSLKNDNYLILGTDVNNGTDIGSINNLNKFVLIIGNEGQGMSKELSTLCDKNIYIKMNERVESLNAAVATSIILYEINNGIN